MSIVTYENATVEELNMAVQCLNRAGVNPITEDVVREWFAKLAGAVPEADQPKPAEGMRRKGTGWTAIPLEVELANRKPRREPIRSLEELRAAGQSTPAYRRPSIRKRIVAPWYKAVTHRMADGTPLKRALELEGVRLTANEIGRLYERTEFRAMYQAERKLYQMERQRRIPRDEREALRKRFVEWFGGKNVPFGPELGNFT